MTAALKEYASQLVGQKKAKDCADRADRAKLRVATERLAGIFKGVGLILTERDPDLTSVNHELGRPVLFLQLRASRNVFKHSDWAYYAEKSFRIGFENRAGDQVIIDNSGIGRSNHNRAPDEALVKEIVEDFVQNGAFRESGGFAKRAGKSLMRLLARSPQYV